MMMNIRFLRALLPNFKDHLEDFNPSLLSKCNERFLMPPTDSPPDKNYFQEVMILAYECFDFVINVIDNRVRSEWKKIVREELTKGGGKLFKIISANDKTYLNVRIGSAQHKECAPELFLKEQTNQWSELWCPRDMGSHEVSLMEDSLQDLRERAKADGGIEVSLNELKTTLKNYKKDTKGSDNWMVTELKQMPDHVLNMFL